MPHPCCRGRKEILLSTVSHQSVTVQHKLWANRQQLLLRIHTPFLGFTQVASRSCDNRSKTCTDPVASLPRTLQRVVGIPFSYGEGPCGHSCHISALTGSFLEPLARRTLSAYWQFHAGWSALTSPLYKTFWHSQTCRKLRGLPTHGAYSSAPSAVSWLIAWGCQRSCTQTPFVRARWWVHAPFHNVLAFYLLNVFWLCMS